MKSTKLIQVLRKLSKEEFKVFSKFIKSPYYNTNQTLIEFWGYLIKYAPNFDREKITIEIFNKLFPEKAYDERKLRQLRFQLFKLVELFLGTEQFQKQHFYQPFLLGKAYQSLSHTKELATHWQRQFAKENIKQDVWTQLHNLQWLQFQYFSDGVTKLEQTPLSIKQMDKALDLFFLGSKLKYACELASWNQIMGTHHSVNGRDVLNNILEENESNLPIFHQLYSLALRLIEFPTESNFFAFKEMYFKKRNQLMDNEQITLLTYLLNFTFKQIQKNNNVYIKEAFDLYKYGIENNLMVVNNQFIEDHFINLLSICSNLKEFNWIDDFLENLDKKPSDVVGDSTFNISMARLSFAKKEFEGCLEYLNNVDHNNIIHSLKARYTIIACYFELKMPKELIFANCKSLSNFAKRNLKVKKELYHGVINFCKIVRELSSSKPSMIKLKELTHIDNEIVFRDWIMSKIEGSIS